MPKNTFSGEKSDFYKYTVNSEPNLEIRSSDSERVVCGVFERFEIG